MCIPDSFDDEAVGAQMIKQRLPHRIGVSLDNFSNRSQELSFHVAILTNRLTSARGTGALVDILTTVFQMQFLYYQKPF